MKRIFSLFVFVLILLSIVAVTAESNRAIRFATEEYVVYIGKNQQIKATVERISEDAPRQTQILWKSSDESIAKVSANGTVNGVSAGIVTITAYAKDDETVSGSVQVEIRKPVANVVLNAKEAKLLIGTADELAKVDLNHEIVPEDAYHRDVEWSSSNEKVATVDENGVVTALSKGNATITAKSMDPSVVKKAVCQISVAQAVASITIDESKITGPLPAPKTLQIKTTVEPADAGNKKLNWSSSDESIAKVNAGGVVQGVSEGTVTITAEAADGSGVKASCTIDIVLPVKRIVIEDKNIHLPEQLTQQLAYTVEPENATVKDIEWKSSNEKVAVVDEYGIVTAVSKGSATITASATDGSGMKTSVNVRVDHYDMVFTDSAPQRTRYYYGSGRFTVKGKVKSGNVSISDVTTTMWASVIGGYGSEEFTVTPVKPGTDTITVTAGRVKTVLDVYVSPDAFRIHDLGFGEGGILAGGDTGVFEGHTYQIFKDKCEWKKARDKCEAKGGHLVTITSREEQRFVEMLNGQNNVLWIGLRKDLDGNWNWVTGEELAYQHWASGEPNNYVTSVYEGENSGAVRPEWNDYHESNTADIYGYICEWDSITVDVE